MKLFVSLFLQFGLRNSVRLVCLEGLIDRSNFIELSSCTDGFEEEKTVTRFIGRRSLIKPDVSLMSEDSFELGLSGGVAV